MESTSPKSTFLILKRKQHVARKAQRGGSIVIPEQLNIIRSICRQVSFAELSGSCQLTKHKYSKNIRKHLSCFAAFTSSCGFVRNSFTPHLFSCDRWVGRVYKRILISALLMFGVWWDRKTYIWTFCWQVIYMIFAKTEHGIHQTDAPLNTNANKNWGTLWLL